MNIELKSRLNFPPEERDLDKILLKLGREVEMGDYYDRDLLTFIKTGSGLYGFEDETRGLDDSNFQGMKDMRFGIIKKYIQTISFLWKDFSDEDIELHIDHTFDDIRGINIQEEITAGRTQDINNLQGATKGLVFELVDAKSLLEKLEVIEFNNPEEIFFFVLDLLGFNNIAAYLNGKGERVVNFTTKRGELDSIALVMGYIQEQNEGNSDIITVLFDKGLPTEKTPDSYNNLRQVLNDNGISRDDLKKIRLKTDEKPKA